MPKPGTPPSGVLPPAGLWENRSLSPRPQGQAEDDGWLIVLIYNAERRCSDVVILAAQDITAGPLAQLKLTHHVPYGLHGSFVPHYFGP